MRILFDPATPEKTDAGAPPHAAEVVTTGPREKIEKPVEPKEARAPDTTAKPAAPPPAPAKPPQKFGSGLTFFAEEDTSDPLPAPKKPSGRWTFFHEKD